MNGDEKKCPQCAETVKAEAKTCRFCGYNFGTETPGNTYVAPVPPKSRPRCAKIVGIIAVIVIGLAILSAILGPADKTGSPTQTAAQPEANAPAIKVSARELEAAYEANEAAAQQQYGDGPLEVTGTISSVSLDFMDKPFLVLQGSNPFTGPQAELTDAAQGQAANLAKGQQIKLRCAGVGEVVGTPMLKECELL